MLKFRVHTNLGEAVAHKLAAASSKAEHVVAIQVKKDTAPFVPASQNKILSENTRVDGGYIIYPGPYARYLYYGKLMVDPDTGSAWAKKGVTKVTTDKNLVFNQAVNPQAQSHWFEVSKSQNLEKWVRVAKKAVKHDL